MIERVSCTLWSVIRTPMPRDRSPVTILMISSTAIGSMPANGSSSKMNFGSVASARAISVLRRSPPERTYPLLFERCVRPNSSSSLSHLSFVPPSRVGHLQNCEDVLPDGQCPKNRRLLREISYAGFRPFVHRKAGNILFLEIDMPLVRSDHPNDHVERRRFSCTVRAEQTDNFSLPHLHGDVFHDCPLFVEFQQILGAKNNSVAACREYRCRQRSIARDFGTAGCMSVINFSGLEK